MKPASDSPAHAQPTLQRSLSLPLTTLYGLGNILGAGIYVLIGKVVGHAGVYAPLSFLLASLLAALTAFTYAELSARFPLSAGEAVYVEEGIGLRFVAALVGLLIIMAGVVSAATILRGFAGYLEVFLPSPDAVVIVVMTLLLGGLAAWGISESVWTAAAVTLLEVVGLLIILWAAAPDMFAAAVEVQAVTLPDIELYWSGIFIGGFLAFYAFIGFEDMVNVAEEVRNPVRNLPRAILLALVVSTLLYFLVALAAVTAAPVGELAASDAPLAWLYTHITAREPLTITLISQFAVINGALIQLIMASRVGYGMARRGWLPAVFGRVNVRTRTPVVSTLAVSLLLLIMALWLPIETLAKATSYFLLLVFALVNLSLWRLKRSGVQPAGVIRVYGWVPVCGAVASTVFVLGQAAIDLGLLSR
ncbi:MAG: APC family permease [Thiohalobacterales bacterium]|nr:APC family permease [Thiohalobacterales bacterium]